MPTSLINFLAVLLPYTNPMLVFGVNLLAQSTILASAGLLVASLLRKKGAAVQSVVLRATLLALMFCPLASFLLSAMGVEGVGIHLPLPFIQRPANASPSEPAPPIGAGSGARIVPNDLAGAKEDFTLSSLRGPDSSSAAAHFPEAKHPTSVPSGESAVAGAIPAQPARENYYWSNIGALALALSILAAAWCIGSALLLARLLTAHLKMGLMRRRAREASADLDAVCRCLASGMVLKAPALLVSSELQSPCLVGLLRPAILLPANWENLSGSASSGIQEVLAHELAHLARGDCFWNLLARVACAAVFFQPLLWVLARRIEETSDEVADDVVVQQGFDRRDYARRLVDITERCRQSRTETLAGMGVVSFRSSLGRRVQRILDTARALSTRAGAKVVAVVLVVGFAAALAAGWIGAAEKADKPDAVEKPKVASEPKTTYRPIPADVPTTTTLRGVVLDEDGKPVSGAPVTAFGPDERKQRTDAKGGFVFEDLRSGGWGVQVDDPRFAKEWLRGKKLQSPFPGDQPSLTLKLSRPRTLRGVLVNEAGDPVPKATVILGGELDEKAGGEPKPFEFDESAKPLGNDVMRKCVTDSKGRFHFERLRPARALILVQHPGDVDNLRIVEVVPNEIRLTLDKGFVLRGRVTSHGKPLENIRVKVDPSHESRTNAAGEFVIAGIPQMMPKEWRSAVAVAGLEEPVHPSLTSVTIEDPVWQSGYYNLFEQEDGTLPFLEIKAIRKDSEEANDNPGVFWVGSKEMDRVEAKDKGSCSVVVRMDGDHRTSSGEGRTVWFGSMSYDEHGNGIYRSGKFRRNGTATFRDLPPGEYWTALLGSDSPHYLTARTNLTTGTVEITLRKGPARVKGAIQCADGLTTGGMVTFSPTKGTWGGGCTAAVGKDGAYEAEGLAFGSYDVSYRGIQRGSNSLPLTITQPETRFDIPLPTGRIRGRVVPAPARQVHSWGMEPGMMPGMMGPRPGMASRLAPLPGTPGMHIPGTPPNQKPQYEPNVQIYMRPFVCQPNAWKGSFWPSATTDEQGRFEMQTPPPGTYTLVCGDCRAKLEVPSPDSRIEVTLAKPDKTGEIAGRLLGDRPRPPQVPVEDTTPVRAYLKDSQGYDFSVPMAAEYVSWDHETYRLRNLPAGAYGLLLSGDTGNKTTTLWIPDIEVREGMSRTQDFEIPKGRDVGIHVRRREHTTIQRGWWLRMPSGDWLPSATLWGYIYLPFGEYEIESFWADRPSVRQKFTVTEGKGAQEVVLRPPDEEKNASPVQAREPEGLAATPYTAIPADVPSTSTLRGIVLAEDGKPVSGAPVTAFGMLREQKQQTDEKGGFVFENLGSVDWGIQVDDPRFAKEWLRGKRILLPRPGDQPPLTLKLARPRTLRGVVLNEAGDPIPGATVILTGELDEKSGSEDAITGGKLQRFVDDESAKPLGNDAIQKRFTDSTGRFHFERLRPGRVLISVQRSGATESLHVVWVVPSEIRLTVDKGFVLRGRVTADGKPLENVMLEILPPRELRTNAAGEFETGIPRLPKEILPAIAAPPPLETVHPLSAVSIGDPVWEGDWYYLVEQEDGTLPFVEIKAFRKDPEGATYEHEAIWLGSKELARMQAKHRGTCSVVVRMEGDPVVLSEADRMVWLNSMSFDEDGGSISKSGRFDRTGTATFRDLPPGEYRIHWVLMRHGSPHYPTVRTNLTTGTVEVTLRKGPARVTGTVQCADGLTTEGGVRFSPADGTQDIECGVAVRRDGTYEMDGLAFGSYDVSYRGNRRWSKSLRLAITRPETRFDIPLLPTGRIRGRVVPAPARQILSRPMGPMSYPGMSSNPAMYGPYLPANQKPQYKPNVHIHRRPTASQPNRGNSYSELDATTDEQGGFEMQTPPPGIYTLVCGDCRANLEVQSSDSQIEVMLKKPDKTGEITGRVLGFSPPRYEGAFESGGPYITAYIKDAQGYDFSAPMGGGAAYGENGTYRLRNLPVGAYGLLVSGKIEDGNSTLWVPGVEVREGLSRTQDIEVPKGRDVDVLVRRRDHTLIQRGWRLCMPNGDWLPSSVFSALIHLPFGEYGVESLWADRPSVRQKFTVTEGKSCQMVFLRPTPQ